MTIQEFKNLDALDKREFLTEYLAEWRMSEEARPMKALIRFHRYVRILADEAGMTSGEVMSHLTIDADLTIEEWKFQGADDRIGGSTLGF